MAFMRGGKTQVVDLMDFFNVVANGEPETIQKMALDQKIDLKSKDALGRTAIHYAVKNAGPETIKNSQPWALQWIARTRKIAPLFMWRFSGVLQN